MARKSNLSAKTNAARNTKAGRAKMSNKNFALPGKKKYRIDDAPHARNALARVAQYGSPAEKAKVKKAVAKKYSGIKVTRVKKR